jgi:hypothetical protein
MNEHDEELTDIVQHVPGQAGPNSDVPPPAKGFVVTVYGATHWRAMSTIKPAAGPIRNPREWRDLTEELAERLRKRYDLAWR